MSGEPEEGQPQKYTYKFRFEPTPPKNEEFEEIDRKELQDYINRLLGIQTKKKPDTRTSVM